MTSSNWFNLPRYCAVLMFIGVTSARGIQNDGEVKAPFELEATDPVAYSQVPKEPRVIYTNGAYAELDLSYYGLFYPNYEGFIGTDKHQKMLRTIHASVDDLAVCVNYDVSVHNVTLGTFICPLPFEPKQFDKCCGLEDAQFCCTSNTEGRLAGTAAFVFITVGDDGGDDDNDDDNGDGGDDDDDDDDDDDAGDNVDGGDDDDGDNGGSDRDDDDDGYDCDDDNDGDDDDGGDNDDDDDDDDDDDGDSDDGDDDNGDDDNSDDADNGDDDDDDGGESRPKSSTVLYTPVRANRLIRLTKAKEEKLYYY
ncbi:hypothetical protein LSH36_51g01018 [Paralvinella palmiformis]|uniref:Uncharacterized protein n=1 Tax=Paralvinella palmiformis TaxID=53620 RepID=A0AAD9NCL2_9ANNE|nr:hypothetical protein LSH36_51g01018 [Paralvinella palmiformis]